MQIDRDQIITFLQGNGDLDTAQQAFTSLPQMVDTSEHAQLLQSIGIDPGQLLEGLGLTDAVDGVSSAVDEHQNTLADFTEGGFDGIVDKVLGFFGGGKN